MGPRTVNIDRVTAKLPHQPFGNLASAGIPGANDENVDHNLRVISNKPLSVASAPGAFLYSHFPSSYHSPYHCSCLRSTDHEKPLLQISGFACDRSEFLGLKDYKDMKYSEKRNGRILQLLEALEPYVMTQRTFDHSNTVEALRGSGIEIPEYGQFIGNVLHYFEEKNSKKQQRKAA